MAVAVAVVVVAEAEADAGSKTHHRLAFSTLMAPLGAPFFFRAPGMARSAMTGAVNRGGKPKREVTWRWKSSRGPGDGNP